MSAVEPLYRTMQHNFYYWSKNEISILETELFLNLYKGLLEFFRTQRENFFKTMKFTMKMEEEMLEENFIQLIIADLLSLEEYSLEGIAFYTQMPEEVIYDIAAGKNTNPSLKLSRKIIELHRLVRPEVYHSILKKVADENSSYSVAK